MVSGLARVVVLTGFLPACASIVSENKSTTYLETEPEKARCELHGQDFKRVVETPNSISLPAESAPITIACKADGYKNTTAVLDTKMDGWIVGNVLFGGLIGIAVDAARGAGQKFPPQFSIILDPERFASVAARDEFYDRRKNLVDEKWGKTVKDLESRCQMAGEYDKSSCQTNLDKAKAERDKELADIELRRTSATVG